MFRVLRERVAVDTKGSQMSSKIKLCPGCRTVLARDAECCIWCGMELQDIKVTSEDVKDFFGDVFQDQDEKEKSK